jgi:hypothetical protein
MWPALPWALPRIVPAEGLKVRDCHVPPEVRLYPVKAPSDSRISDLIEYTVFWNVVSSSDFALHSNERVFPEPSEPRPEKWLDGNVAEQNRHLNLYSRDSRTCIGIK